MNAHTPSASAPRPRATLSLIPTFRFTGFSECVRGSRGEARPGRKGFREISESESASESGSEIGSFFDGAAVGARVAAGGEARRVDSNDLAAPEASAIVSRYVCNDRMTHLGETRRRLCRQPFFQKDLGRLSVDRLYAEARSIERRLRRLAIVEQRDDD